MLFTGLGRSVLRKTVHFIKKNVFSQHPNGQDGPNPSIRLITGAGGIYRSCSRLTEGPGWIQSSRAL